MANDKEIVSYFYNADTNTAYKRVTTSESDKRYIMFIDVDNNVTINETDHINKFAEVIDLEDDESVIKMLKANDF